MGDGQAAQDAFKDAMEGRLPEAEQRLDQFLQSQPDDKRLRFARAVVRLAQGRYADAFPDYDLRHEVTNPRPKPSLPFPEWSGEPLAGKSLAIFPEQGLGDQIMFARFVPELRRQGAEVTLLCTPSLRRLFAPLADRVVAAEGEVNFPDPDFWTLTNSLLRLVPAVAAVPSAAYLHVGARPVSGQRVGVMATGNPHHHNDANRSLPTAVAAELRSLPDVLNLQPEVTGARDMLDTAEIIEGLDLVISVDTSVAHLAGALGKPVWILLPAENTDWRWMRGRVDSPWYPSARLYRQTKSGEWSAVLAKIRDDLADYSTTSETIAIP